MKNYPKSLDKNYFNKIYNKINIINYKKEDLLFSMSRVTSISIIRSLNLLPQKINMMIIMGGGAYNKFIIKDIKKLFDGKVITADEINLPGDFIEAELIAFLSARFLNKLPTTFPETTGVKKELVGGKLY